MSRLSWGTALRTALVGVVSGALIATMSPAATAATDPTIITIEATCVNVTISGAQTGCGLGIPVGDRSAIVATVPAGTQPQIVVRGNATPSAQESIVNAWGPLLNKALEETAAARKVTADDINQAYGLPEARALLVVQMFDIIRRHTASPASLTVAERTAYDALQQAVNRERKAIVAKEQADFAGVTANPCGVQDKAGNWVVRPWAVPVGDPLAYYKTIAPACRSIWNGITAEYPLPTVGQFREWARSQVMEDHFTVWATGKDPNDTDPFTAQLDVIPNGIHKTSPWLTREQAIGEAKREFTTGMASLIQGFAYLAGTGAELSSIPASQRTPAEDQLLTDIVQQVGEFGADSLRDLAIDMASGLVELFVEFGGEEISAFAANLSGLLEAGTATFGAVAGATAALAIEIAFLVGQQKARDGIAADRAGAQSPPSIDVLATSEDGRRELMTALMISILPDNGAEALQEPAGLAAAPTSGDLFFSVSGRGETTSARRQNLALTDWARSSSPNVLVSTSRGWLTKADLLTFTQSLGTGPYAAPDTAQVTLGTRRYSPVINYIDWSGSYWRAWLTGDTFIQTRYADPVAGTVKVVKAVQGLGGPCPPGSGFGVTISASVLGATCVLGTGTRFSTDLHAGDSVQIGQQIKVVEAVYSDTAFTTTEDFEEVLPSGQKLMKVLPITATCLSTGQCVKSPTIEFLSGPGQWRATISGNQAPVLAPTFSATLVPAYLAPDGSASSLAIGAGRPVTFRANATDPDPGDHVRINWEACELVNNDTLCDLSTTIPLTNQQAAGNSFTYTFRAAGKQTVKLTVRDDHGGVTSQTIALTVVPTPPKWQSAKDPTFTAGQFGSYTFSTQPGVPTPALKATSNTPLPPGLTLVDNNDGTATLSGTPDANAAGHYPITLRAEARIEYTKADGTVAPLLLQDDLGLAITVTGPQSIEGRIPRAWTYGRPLPLEDFLTTTSGLPFTATVAAESAGICRVTGTVLTPIGRGAPNCQVTISQPGDDAVQAATPVSGTITIFAAVANVTVSGTTQYSDTPAYSVTSTSGLLFNDVLQGAITSCEVVGLTLGVAGVESAAGPYPLQGCSGLTNQNYVLRFAGTLDVSAEDATLVNTTKRSRTPGVAALSARVTPAPDGTAGDATKATVDFLLFRSTNATDTPDWSATGVAANTAGVAAATLTGLPKDKYRVVIRTSPGNGYYKADPITAQLRVKAARVAPVVTLQPQDARLPKKGTVTITAAATGIPDPTALWQRSDDRGRSWRDIDGATTTSLILSRRQRGSHDYLVRAVFTNIAGTAITASAQVGSGSSEGSHSDSSGSSDGSGESSSHSSSHGSSDGSSHGNSD